MGMDFKKRNISIDRFRGFAVLVMITVQIWRDFYNLELLSQLGNHKSGFGLTIINGLQFADVFAPMFLFAVALTYKLSYDKRIKEYGKKETIKHFLKRYISLIGIGGIIRAIESVLFYFSKGHFEHTIDPFFFLGLSILLLLVFVWIVLKLFVKRKNNLNRTISITSKAVFGMVAYIAILCIVATARDFFIQVLFHKKYGEFQIWGYWEALQAIGAAGLVTLMFIKLKNSQRFIVATVLLIGYSLFHESGNNSDIISVYAQQGGFIGIIGQSCILLFGTVLAELFFADPNRLTKYLSAIPGFGLAAVIALHYILPTMRSVSPSYILLNVFISGSVFLLFKLYDYINLKFDILELLGKNALLMYMLQYILVYGTKEIIGYQYINNASDLFAISFTFIMLFIMIFIAFLLDKKRIIVKL